MSYMCFKGFYVFLPGCKQVLHGVMRILLGLHTCLAGNEYAFRCFWLYQGWDAVRVIQSLMWPHAGLIRFCIGLDHREV